MTVKFRQHIERKIARATIKALLNAGFTLGVNDGEETVLRRCTDPKTILAAMFSTDEDYLLVYEGAAAGGKKPPQIGGVRFIYGNDGWDVISDYTLNLEEALKPVCALSDRIYDKWYS